MMFRTFGLAATFAILLAACGDDTTGAGGSGASSGDGGAGGSTSDGGSTPTSTTNTTNGSGGAGGDGTGGDAAGGAGGDGAGGDGAGGDGAGGDGAGGGPTCDVEGFVPVSQDAGYIGPNFLYFALSSEAAPSDDLSIELYSDIDMAGDRTITDENYSTCDPCVLLRQNCDSEFNCEKNFLATSGTIAIDQFEGTFAGTLEDVTLIEVTIGEGAVSTPVEGGETWCLDGYAFEADIQE